MSKLVAWLSAAGGFVLTTFALPIAITQYPEVFNNPWVLPICIGVAFLCFVPAIWQTLPRFFGFVERRVGGRFPRMVFPLILILGAIAGTAFFGLAFKSYQLHREHLAQKTDGAATIPVPQELPTVSIRLLPSTLPILVPPNSSVQVLQLNPGIREFTFEVQNRTNGSLTWPEDLAIGKGKLAPAPEQILVSEFTNHSSKDLVDVNIFFEISFYDFKEIRAERKGTKLTVPLRGKGGVTFGIWDAKNKADRVFTETDSVESHRHRVVLPAIKAGAIGRIYLVNQSRYIAKFPVPTTMNAIVSGDVYRRDMPIVRTGVNVQDAVPWHHLVPSRHPWKGVPDAR